MPQPPALPGNFVSSTTPTTPTPALHDDGNGSQQVPSEPGTPDGRRAPTKSVCAARPRGRQPTPVTATAWPGRSTQPGPRPPEHAHRYGHLPTGTRYGSSIEVDTARPSRNRRAMCESQNSV